MGTVRFYHLYVKVEYINISKCDLPHMYMILTLRLLDSKTTDLQTTLQFPQTPYHALDQHRSSQDPELSVLGSVSSI